MLNRYLVFDGASVLDVSARCADCETSLDERRDYEPFVRLDTSTGETMHVDICASCIADIEHVKANNARITGRLARQLRRARICHAKERIAYA